MGRRIGAAVLLSILAIEAAILVPSYKNYERDLLLRLESSGRAEIMATYRSARHNRDRDLLIMGRSLIRPSGARTEGSHVRGGRLHRADGSLIGSFGEDPALTLEAVRAGARQTQRSADGMRYDVVWPAEATGLPISVAARLDASWIGPELQAFVWRISGLVLLISVFVTAVTMAIFGRSVLLPVLRLRASLTRAHQDPTHAERYVLAETRADELGELMRAADQLLHRVSSLLETQESRLSETADHLMVVLGNSVTSIITMDSNGIVTSFNPAAEKLFGYRAQQVVSRNVSMLMPDPDRGAHDGYLANYGTGGKTDIMGRTRMVIGRHKDGHTIPLELLLGEMMVRDERHFVGFLTDLTERVAAEEQLRLAHDTLEQRVRDRTERLEREVVAHQQTEEALRASEEQIRLITDALPILIAYVDKDFKYRFANKTAANWNARPREDIIGRRPEEVLGAAALEILHPYARKALSGQNQAFEETITFHDGQTRDISGNYVPHLSEDGSVQGIFIMAQDITARKRAESELEKRVGDLQIANIAIEDQGAELVKLAEDLSAALDQADDASRAKSEFLTSMSHELRTPLNAIIGFSEILSTEALGPIGSDRYRDYASDIHESGHHLLALINDVLDLAKIESGQDELHEENIDIPQVTRSIIRLIGQRAEKSGVNLKLELSDPLPGLRGDERRLKQILVNLLSNAVKFTEAGGTVTLKIWCREDSGLVFQVIDTGIGIAREDIPKVLSQFGQIESSVSRRHVGTGLGLPLAKSLVELHGGSLDLQSEVGVGTTVTVRFPAERTVESPTQATPRSVV